MRAAAASTPGHKACSRLKERRVGSAEAMYKLSLMTAVRPYSAKELRVRSTGLMPISCSSSFRGFRLSGSVMAMLAWLGQRFSFMAFSSRRMVQ